MQHTVSSSSSQVAPLQQLQPDRGPRTGPPRNPPATDSTALRCELPVGAPSQLRFKLPVDVEHKAVQLQLLQLARPHMMAFHLSWICLFLTFTTTFAPAALLPVLQVSYLARCVEGCGTCTGGGGGGGGGVFFFWGGGGGGEGKLCVQDSS